MKVGCFALIDPFQTFEHQLNRIHKLGFHFADVTDNFSGGSLGRDGGFHAAVSLDENPMDILRTFTKIGLTPTSVCAHARLLDPSSPGRYGNTEIMKAVRLASDMKIKHVITTEHEPSTEWAKKLSFEQKVLVTAEKLYEPVRLASDLGVSILLENHGPLTDSIKGMYAIIEALDSPQNLGVCLDTGNSWLGGSDPVEFAKRFKDKIGHIHWKDLSQEWEYKRGSIFGCGFSTIALGEGVIDIASVFDILKSSKIIKYTTLEVAGDNNLIKSSNYLISLGVEQ